MTSRPFLRGSCVVWCETSLNPNVCREPEDCGQKSRPEEYVPGLGNLRWVGHGDGGVVFPTSKDTRSGPRVGSIRYWDMS